MKISETLKQIKNNLGEPEEEPEIEFGKAVKEMNESFEKIKPTLDMSAEAVDNLRIGDLKHESA